MCIHPSMDTGVVSTFLAAVNHTAVNMTLQISVEIPAFNSFGWISSSGIAGQYSSLVF